jgi:hypothetical protein
MKHLRGLHVVALTALMCAPSFALPRGARAALDRALAAVNNADTALLGKLSADGTPKAFGWVRPRSLMGAFMGDSRWQAAVLEPPCTNGATALAVFHKWHSPESDGDHIVPMLRTRAGWRFGPEVPETDTQGYRIRHHVMTVRVDPTRAHAAVSDRLTLERVKAPDVAFLRLSNDFVVTSAGVDGKPATYRQAGGVVAVRIPRRAKVTVSLAYAGRVKHPSFSSIEPGFAVLTSYYWPVIGRLPATAETTAIVPKGWKAISQGELVETREGDANSLWKWSNKVPVNYFTLNAAPYHVRSRKADGIELQTWLLRDEPQLSEGLLESLSQAMAYYRRRFGGYPYSRYTIVEGGTTMGFAALEGYSFATYGTTMLQPSVVAHELSHTWWGGIVPNTYLRSWWNEAFASWSDDSFSRFRNGVEALHPTDRAWWPAAPRVSDWPLATARHDAEDIDGIAYRKGMVVLRLIEMELGRDGFDRVLRRFIRENSGRDDPDWPDFRRSLEAETGRDWGVFFEQWVGRSGWPVLFVRDAKWTESDGGYTVTGTLAQEGKPYALDVPLRIETADGAADQAVRITGTTAAFEVRTQARPRRLLIDPDYEVPRDLGPMNNDLGGRVFNDKGDSSPLIQGE